MKNPENVKMESVNLMIVNRVKKDAPKTRLFPLFKPAMNMDFGHQVKPMEHLILAMIVRIVQRVNVLIERICPKHNLNNANVVWKDKFTFLH